MLISHVTQASPDVNINEDLVVAGPNFAVVLDGATQADGVDTGCVHEVTWLVNRLGGHLAQLLLTTSSDLTDILAQAIENVMAQHADTCDLSNPDSPATTVSIVRQNDTAVDYLVLADSPVALRQKTGEITVVLDNRNDFLPGYTIEIVREQRNTPGGFWVASNKPDAAKEALTGTADASSLDCVGMFSDGASRLVERHGMRWSGLVDLLSKEGPAAVIERVRGEDQKVAGHRAGKVHDDATATLCRIDTP